jgi:uncharacterized membrane protein/mono/diheme cytochrome c family protein
MLARLVLACCLALAVAPLARPADLAADSREFFLQRVRPVLEDRCIECHGEHRQKAHLKLNDRADILTGGDSGPAIVTGAPDRSLLLQRVRARGTDDVMPPREPPLDDAQIADLAAWVAAGAPWVHADGSIEPAPSAGAATASGGNAPATAPPAADISPPADRTPPPAAKPKTPLVGRVHPLVVHFPIACLLLALLAEFLVVVRGPAWEPTVALLLLVGVAGAAVAVVSGTWFASDGTMFARHDLGLKLHEVAGWITLVLGLSAGALLLASRSSPRARLYFRVVLMLTAVATAVTGHLGGAMVYPELGLF